MRTLEEHAQTRYFSCFALALSATMGVAFSANLFTLFIFYEALTIVDLSARRAQGDGGSQGRRRKYLIYLLGAAKLLVAARRSSSPTTSPARSTSGPGGIFTPEVSSAHPTLLFVVFVLFLFGLAKNAVMPMHSWLPAAMVAPTPVSALLHAVAVVKTGVFATLRVSCSSSARTRCGQLGADTLALVARR